MECPGRLAPGSPGEAFPLQGPAIQSPAATRLAPIVLTILLRLLARAFPFVERATEFARRFRARDQIPSLPVGKARNFETECSRHSRGRHGEPSGHARAAWRFSKAVPALRPHAARADWPRP